METSAQQTFYVTVENQRLQREVIQVNAKHQDAAKHIAEWQAREEHEDLTYQSVDCWRSLFDAAPSASDTVSA